MNYAFLIARQRSGTGALGSVLDKHPDLKYLGEVFHPANVGQDQNYFTFLKEAVIHEPENCLPDRQYELFEAFLEKMAQRHPGKTLIVDVKYRSLHQLDGGWRGLVERPSLLAEAVRRQTPIMHLTRRNALQSFVSGRLAEANKVWHTSASDQIKVVSTVINIRQLSNYIVSTEREIALIEEWTHRYSRLEIFDYADMFDDEGKIQGDLGSRIAKLLGIEDFADRAPAFIKQAPASIEASVENFDLVKRALTGSNFEWMLG